MILLRNFTFYLTAEETDFWLQIHQCKKNLTLIIYLTKLDFLLGLGQVMGRREISQVGKDIFFMFPNRVDLIINVEVLIVKRVYIGECSLQITRHLQLPMSVNLVSKLLISLLKLNLCCNSNFFFLIEILLLLSKVLLS